MEKKHCKLYNFLFYFSFGFYLIVLFAILFRTSHPTRVVNMIPFHTITNFLSRGRILHVFTLSNVFGNIIIFIPLGIYSMFFWRKEKSSRNVLGIGLVSLLVEIIQYTFKIGIGDIDDVILNTIGGYLGIVIYRKLLLKLNKNEQKLKNILSIIVPIGIMIGFLMIGILKL